MKIASLLLLPLLLACPWIFSSTKQSSSSPQESVRATVHTGYIWCSGKTRGEAYAEAKSRIPLNATVTGNRVVRYSGAIEKWIVTLYWHIER